MYICVIILALTYTGLDFNPAPVTHVFEPSTITVDQPLNIEVIDDDVFESNEVFLVRLNITLSDPIDEDMLEIGIQYLQIRIGMDPNDGNVLIYTIRESV